jgi:hypothetical protein
MQPSSTLEVLPLIRLITQERPCARCIKRNIGHLCHDEPREAEASSKRSKSHHSNSAEDEETSTDNQQRPIENGMSNTFDQRQDRIQDQNLGLSANPMNANEALQLVQPTPVSGLQAGALNNNNNSTCKPIPPRI